jgi:hypothetical protein
MKYRAQCRGVANASCRTVYKEALLSSDGRDDTLFNSAPCWRQRSRSVCGYATCPTVRSLSGMSQTWALYGHSVVSLPRDASAVQPVPSWAARGHEDDRSEAVAIDWRERGRRGHVAQGASWPEPERPFARAAEWPSVAQPEPFHARGQYNDYHAASQSVLYAPSPAWTGEHFQEHYQPHHVPNTDQLASYPVGQFQSPTGLAHAVAQQAPQVEGSRVQGGVYEHWPRPTPAQQGPMQAFAAQPSTGMHAAIAQRQDYRAVEQSQGSHAQPDHLHARHWAQPAASPAPETFDASPTRHQASAAPPQTYSVQQWPQPQRSYDLMSTFDDALGTPDALRPQHERLQHWDQRTPARWRSPGLWPPRHVDTQEHAQPSGVDRWASAAAQPSWVPPMDREGAQIRHHVQHQAPYDSRTHQQHPAGARYASPPPPTLQTQLAGWGEARSHARAHESLQRDDAANRALQPQPRSPSPAARSPQPLRLDKQSSESGQLLSGSSDVRGGSSGSASASARRREDSASSEDHAQSSDGNVLSTESERATPSTPEHSASSTDGAQSSPRETCAAQRAEQADSGAAAAPARIPSAMLGPGSGPIPGPSTKQRPARSVRDAMLEALANAQRARGNSGTAAMQREHGVR